MRCAVKDQLLKGTMILTIAGFATRVIGFCYRIFLAGELGEVNLGIYQLIFPVYSICFTIYAAGIQTAVSQLISHQPQKNHGQIIKAGITLSLCLAVILSFSLFSFRTVIAHSFLGADKTAPLLFVLAFIFPFCGVTSTINGYFYGKNNARIPAVSAPTKAAPAGGMAVISTISSRRVFAMAPIPAAVAASRTGLLNIIENPNTPQKLVIRRSKIQAPTGKDIFK